jgi:steroid delta-isomerase-like uncharacterized protein
MDLPEPAQELLLAWDARDLVRFGSLLADDVLWYDPAMPAPPARGKEEVLAFAGAVLDAFPDFRYEIQPPVCVSRDKSRCAIVWRITATHLRPLDPPGYAPTGRSASFEGVDVLDVQDGKIARILTAFDALPAAEQLLDLRLRPPRHSWREWILVRAQRLLAYLRRR